MRRIQDLTDLTNKNKQLGNHKIAKKQFAKAAAKRNQLEACIKADKDSKGPFQAVHQLIRGSSAESVGSEPCEREVPPSKPLLDGTFG